MGETIAALEAESITDSSRNSGAAPYSCRVSNRHRGLIYALALLLSCGAPAASPSATPLATAAAGESPSATPTGAIALRDLSVVATGEPHGDHALVMVFENDGGPYGGGANRVWDIPLDGSTPRSIVAYTRAERPLSGYFGVDLTRQVSPDGRQLVLTDPVDVAGKGLVVIDLISGSARVIATPDIADEPSWSPDGQRIAYRGYALQGPLQNESGLWIVSVGTRSASSPRRCRRAPRLSFRPRPRISTAPSGW